jgi:hypothetical protein
VVGWRYQITSVMIESTSSLLLFMAKIRYL